MLTRRDFAQVLTAAGVAQAILPVIAKATPAAPKRAIRLNANENPYGPSPAALRALHDALPEVNRYPDAAIDELIDGIARFHGLPNDWVLTTDGSSEALKVAASTFATKRVVMASPTFEPIGFYTQWQGGDVTKVPLTASHAHDLPRMLEAARGEALIYVCNPNNPTATITPKDDIRALLANAPAGVTVLVDEAYHHYADSPQYESVIPLIKSQPNLVVTRTFSKIYGMAGLRCGYALGQAKTIESMQQHGQFDSVNVLAAAAARASLLDTAYADLGRKRNRETKQWLAAELEKLGYRFLPSDANFVFLDLRREVAPVIKALHEHGVDAGRPFPPMTHFLRVSIATPEEMQRFVEAFRAVMA